MNYLVSALVLLFSMLLGLSEQCPFNTCVDNDGQCRIPGFQNAWEEEIENGFKVHKFCKNLDKRIRIFKAECPTPGGMIYNGQQWTNETSCYRYWCILRRNENQVKMAVRSIGCPFNGTCIGRGQKWTEIEGGKFNVTYQCRHPNGARKKRIDKFQCLWEDRWIDMGSDEILTDMETCDSFECPTRRRVVHTEVFRLRRVHRACPYNGTCVERGKANRWNETMSTFIVEKQCRFLSANKKIDNVKFYCEKQDGNYVGKGASWKDENTCTEYKCTVTKKVVQNETVDWVSNSPKRYGCKVDGECKDLGASWEQMVGDSNMFKIEKSCEDDGSVSNGLGYCKANATAWVQEGEAWDDKGHCRRYRCSVTRTADAISIQPEGIATIGCNIANHGCILNGDVEWMQISGNSYQIACTDGQWSFYNQADK